MILAWFKANKLIGIVAIVLAAIVVLGTLTHLIDAGQDQARDAGVQTERAATQGKVLQHVDDANKAEETYRSDPTVRDAGCLRDATNPEDC